MDGNQPATHSRRKRSTVKAVVLILALLLVTSLSLPVGVLAEGPPDLPLTEEPSDVTPTPTPEPDVLPTPTPVDPALAEPTPETTASAMCEATGAEVVATDREDYAPEEIVAIIGSGFAPSCDVLVQVTRPDGSIVAGDGSFGAGSDTVATNADGAFSYDYILDGIEGLYLVDVIGDGGIVLARSSFTDAIPGTNPATYADSGRTIARQTFERGDTIYWRFPASGAITSPDIVAKYRFRILYGTTVVSTSACLTPNASGILDYDEVIGSSYPLSDSVRTTLRLIIFSSEANCTSQNFTGSVERNVGSGGFIFQAYAFTTAAARNACTNDATCGSPTPRPVVQPGDTVYMKVRGFTANRAFSGMRFIKPDASSTVCPMGPLTADASGAIAFDYPSTCAPIGSTASDIGAWTIDVTGVGSGSGAGFVFGELQSTNVDAFSVKAPLTVTTAVHDAADTDVTGGTVPLGATVHDTATVAGAISGLAAPTPTFTIYENGSCTGSGTAVVTTGDEAGASRSADVGPLAAGAYSFKASVAEDGSYLGDESPCESFTVLTGTATVVTELHRQIEGNDHLVLGTTAGVPYGATTHDKAIVTGVTGVDPTGTIRYDLFSSNGVTGCTGTPIDTETVAVGAESSSKSSLAPGRYSYLATYSGDANYPGAVSATCEILEVGRATPGVATEVHAGTDHATDVQGTALPLGTSVHDKTIITPVDGLAVNGTITYTFFDGTTNEFADQCDGPRTSETVAVGSESSVHGPLPAGSYAFRATYNGNENYKPATGPCETFTVDKATPTIRTEVHSATHVVLAPPTSEIPLGSIIHDSAILGGQVDGIVIGGTVTYTVYRTAFGETAQNCAGPIFKAAETVAVGTEMTATGALATGRYTIKAVYSGDANYLPVTAACEIFEVAKATPTIATQVHRAIAGNAHVIVPSPSEIPLASLVHDSAILGGQVDGFVIDGNVTYTVYRTAFGDPAQNCTGPVFKDAEVVAVGSETTPIGPLATGRYTIKAVYGGNANYTEATAACEIFEVAKATPRVETVVRLETDGGESTPVSNPGVVALGSTVHDRAFVVGKVDGFGFTGTVTFTLFKGSQNCTGTIVAGPEEVALGSPFTESSSFGPLTAGRYSYLATYNGNENYTSASGPCEIFEVPKGATSTTTELHEGSRDNAATHIVIPVGGFTFSPTVHDKATVTGEVTGVPMTGQVRYTFFTNTNPWAAVCDGQPRLIETKNVGEESSDRASLPPGQYAFRAFYLGDANYATSNSTCEPFTVVPNDAVTSSSLCTFDFDSTLPGSQFRLIYTPDLANPVYKLNASNPGQFYYNVFYTGVGGEVVTITIPAPFVTQGANPVHVYTGVTPVTTDGVTCYTPGAELTGATIEGAPITGTGGDQITVTLPTLSNGFAYIAVHLDYGWKKVLTACMNDLGTAKCTVPGTNDIPNNTPYAFSFTDGSSGSTTVYSINEFKKNPGVGGSLLKANSEEPIADTSVEVWIGTKKMATVKTDIDGWFMWSYKYTGKPVTFTAKVPAYGLVQSATLKSNGFVALSFLAP